MVDDDDDDAAEETPTRGEHCGTLAMTMMVMVKIVAEVGESLAQLVETGQQLVQLLCGL